MHEWLSGGVSPCQGEGRGFESRLVLLSSKRASDVTGSPFYRFFFRNKNMKKLLVDFEKM